MLDFLIQYSGTVGLLMIVMAWTWGTWIAIKHWHVGLSFGFIMTYCVASALLTLHSAVIGDGLFLLLNAIATVQSFLNLIIKYFPAPDFIRQRYGRVF